MIRLREIKESLLHFFFPHVCAGCGTDLPGPGSELCLRCLHDLPETGFEKFCDNPIEKIFVGRLPIQSAAAFFYFSRHSIMQSIMHEIKYKGNKELGLQMGRLMGLLLQNSGRIIPDLLIPLPLFPGKQKLRGYNQSLLLCHGMAEILHIPVSTDAIVRPAHTETQTRKGRVERWQNMEGKFLLKNRVILCNKHLLLVDDVVTTGATLESCGVELLKETSCRLSIATLCFASR